MSYILILSLLSTILLLTQERLKPKKKNTVCGLSGHGPMTETNQPVGSVSKLHTWFVLLAVLQQWNLPQIIKSFFLSFISFLSFSSFFFHFFSFISFNSLSFLFSFFYLLSSFVSLSLEVFSVISDQSSISDNVTSRIFFFFLMNILF